jgi:hypothetical protein
MRVAATQHLALRRNGWRLSGAAEMMKARDAASALTRTRSAFEVGKFKVVYSGCRQLKLRYRRREAG